ncbi:hypothetical protein Tco_0966025 [Tanacetum coccineum]
MSRHTRNQREKADNTTVLEGAESELSHRAGSLLYLHFANSASTSNRAHLWEEYGYYMRRFAWKITKILDTHKTASNAQRTVTSMERMGYQASWRVEEGVTIHASRIPMISAELSYTDLRRLNLRRYWCTSQSFLVLTSEDGHREDYGVDIFTLQYRFSKCGRRNQSLWRISHPQLMTLMPQMLGVRESSFHGGVAKLSNYDVPHVTTREWILECFWWVELEEAGVLNSHMLHEPGSNWDWSQDVEQARVHTLNLCTPGSWHSETLEISERS